MKNNLSFFTRQISEFGDPQSVCDAWPVVVALDTAKVGAEHSEPLPSLTLARVQLVTQHK